MRIIIATPIFPPETGGPATYTRELAERLTQQNHEITVVAYADAPEAIAGVRVVAVSKERPTFSRLISYFFALNREAKKADIIYVQNAVASGLPAALVGMLSGKPVVLKFVGDEAWERATQAGLTAKPLNEFLARPAVSLRIGFFIDIQKFVLNRVSKIVPPSDFLRTIITTYYGVDAQKVQVNYNAFDAGMPAPDIARKPHQVLTVARLVAWKGVDGIIRTTAILKKKFPDIHLVVAGEGPEEESLQTLARTLGLGEAVEFRGRMPRADVARLQAESAVQVLNSTYEGLPHIALESFATRTPLIATNIPGTTEAVIDGQTGLLVPPKDDQKLADAIERYFTDPELCNEVTAGGAAALENTFSWPRHIEKLLAIFILLKQS